MKKKIRYEYEYNRFISSPEKWFDYCKRMLAKHNINLEDWVDELDFIDRPYGHCNDKWEREKRDGIIEVEICKYMPCEIQLYLSTLYNFIMEWDDGHGYLYIVEYENVR